MMIALLAISAFRRAVSVSEQVHWRRNDRRSRGQLGEDVIGLPQWPINDWDWNALVGSRGGLVTFHWLIVASYACQGSADGPF
jgi:hypothetical protein